MSPCSSFAKWLSKTKFGQKSLAKSDELAIFKQNTGLKFYIGLVLIALSFLITLPALAFLSYLSIELDSVLIIAIGGPAVFIIVHIIFAVGVYLSGKNYTVDFLQWITKRFLHKF